MVLDLDVNVWKIIVDTMQEGLMVVNREGEIVFANKAFETLLGYSSAELVGQTCEVFQCDRCFSARSEGLDKYCALFKNEEIRSSECIFRSKNGIPLHLLKNAAVIRNEEGEVIGGVETLTDLSRVMAGEEIIASLKQQLRGRKGFADIVGKSEAMQQVFDLAASAANSEAPVVVYGESGTGKELLASALHQKSMRAAEPFIKVNCAALNENLLESELFGHVKGAFTGAEQNRIGRFEAAHGGSIFLDEVGDLPMATQTKLLRVLQEKEIERVGDHRPIKINVRIITATHKDLDALIKAGQFREDLFYRINVIPIHLPPLRQRQADIPLLAEKFIREIAERSEQKISGLTDNALDILTNYRWPGNVRELINAIEYAFVVCQTERIDAGHLPPHMRRENDTKENPPVGSGREAKIRAALDKTAWNRNRAARILGVSRVTLWKWMKQHGLS
ncbi:MAG: sigma 54-interacting transcriptional regulator [Thermodesulfobacteriota bacterium]